MLRSSIDSEEADGGSAERETFRAPGTAPALVDVTRALPRAQDAKTLEILRRSVASWRVECVRDGALLWRRRGRGGRLLSGESGGAMCLTAKGGSL